VASLSRMTHNLIREFEGREYVKASASGAGNDCLFLPWRGPRDRVADSKSGMVLAVPAGQLLALARQA
jgi:hypothetical protein